MHADTDQPLQLHMPVHRWIIAAIRFAWLLLVIAAMAADGLLQYLRGGLRTDLQGALWNHGWCRRLVRALGVRSSISGEFPGLTAATSQGFEAIVCNHLSYIDVLLLGATLPCIMVAKSEVRGWPIVGWITQRACTVYVYRGGRCETYPEVNASMARAFRSGLPVLFFPEGTTTNGSELLPFRRGLFHSVLRDRVHVRTAAIRYRLHPADRAATVPDNVCWVGDASLLPHLFRLLALRGIHASIRFGPPTRGNDRFILSQNARIAIAGLCAELDSEATPTSASSTINDRYQPAIAELL